ncbi:MAG: hypothetical protein IH991_18915 [Planctomycetes bacterium]|nr:hypothetical protein [Planctomycetota bacterium]
MAWNYALGVGAVAIAFFAPLAVLVWLARRPKAHVRIKAAAVCLSLLPAIVFIGDFAIRGIQDVVFRRQFDKIHPGMATRDAKALVGDPSKVWEAGEALHNLVWQWRNRYPIWEYDRPISKCILVFESKPPFVRFRSSLDNPRLFSFGPPRGGYIFQVADDDTVGIVGRFSELDVQMPLLERLRNGGRR